jgi:hypothetical protein
MSSYVATEVVWRLERDLDLPLEVRDRDRERPLVSEVFETVEDFRLEDERRLSARNNKTAKITARITDPILKKSKRPDEPFIP